WKSNQRDLQAAAPRLAPSAGELGQALAKPQRANLHARRIKPPVGSRRGRGDLCGSRPDLATSVFAIDSDRDAPTPHPMPIDRGDSSSRETRAASSAERLCVGEDLGADAASAGGSFHAKACSAADNATTSTDWLLVAGIRQHTDSTIVIITIVRLLELFALGQPQDRLADPLVARRRFRRCLDNLKLRGRVHP